MSNIGYSLDKKFETTVMYYFTFDETSSTKVFGDLQKAKDIQTLNKLIEM